MSSTASAAVVNTPADCAAATGKLAVRAVAISSGDTITLQATPPDGTYVGQGTVDVFCQAKDGSSIGDIKDAFITINVNPTAPLKATQFTITGAGVTTPSNPATIGPVTGLTTFTITGASDILPPGVAAADVGVQFEIVADAWGAPLTDPITGKTIKPGTFGDVFAATPELDSIALFASGAVGLLGYAALRRRARSSRKD